MALFLCMCASIIHVSICVCAHACVCALLYGPLSQMQCKVNWGIELLMVNVLVSVKYAYSNPWWSFQF